MRVDAAHVVALRYYTSPAFASLNDPLRSGRTPHPFPATVAFVDEGIRKLRRPEAQQPGQRLWRGLRTRLMFSDMLEYVRMMSEIRIAANKKKASVPRHPRDRRTPETNNECWPRSQTEGA